MKLFWLSATLVCCTLSKKLSRQEHNKSSALAMDLVATLDATEVANLFCFGILNRGEVSSCSSKKNYEEEVACVHGIAPQTFPAGHLNQCFQKLHEPIVPTAVPQLSESLLGLAQKAKSASNRVWMAVQIKNQGIDLFTWVAHYLSLGVEHIVVFDNDSGDNPKRILQPYISKGLVTYRTWPGEAVQFQAYTEAAKMATAAGANWLGALDVDEWLFLERQHSSLNDLVMAVPDWCNSLQLNWAFVSGEDMFNAREVVKLGDSAEKLRQTKWIPNKNSKSFTRLPRQGGQSIPTYPSPHYSDAKPQCNTNSQHTSGPFVDPPVMASAYVLHRQRGTLEGFVRKGIRGRADCVHCVNSEPMQTLQTGGILETVKTWLQQINDPHAPLPDRKSVV